MCGWIGGIDSSDWIWPGGSQPGRLANETGVAVLDSAGRVVDAGWTRELEETVDRIVAAAGPSALVFVDASLVVDKPQRSTSM
jgi:hypothetical protein